MVSYPVLADFFVGRRKLASKAILCLGASFLLAASAWVSVPFFPAPLSLQSLAVLLVGAGLGSRSGALAVLLYLFEGALGFPVFAGGLGGMAALASPTFGYKIGFVAAAFLAGYAAERGRDRGFWSALPWLAAAHQLIFAGGVLWLCPVYGFEQAFAVGYLPFIGLDAVKFVLAALLLSGFWRLPIAGKLS